MTTRLRRPRRASACMVGVFLLRPHSSCQQRRSLLPGDHISRSWLPHPAVRAGLGSFHDQRVGTMITKPSCAQTPHQSGHCRCESPGVDRPPTLVSPLAGERREVPGGSSRRSSLMIERFDLLLHRRSHQPDIIERIAYTCFQVCASSRYRRTAAKAISCFVRITDPDLQRRESCRN